MREGAPLEEPGRNLFRWRSRTAARLGLAVAVMLALSGDRLRSASTQINGIDPLDVLDIQVTPNVLFVLDTSSTMGIPATGSPATDIAYWTGGDDVLSRLYQSKVAIRHSIRDSSLKANFGIAQVGPPNTAKRLWTTGTGSGGAVDVRKGPFIWVSVDPALSTAITPVNAGAASGASRPAVEASVTFGDALARILEPDEAALGASNGLLTSSLPANRKATPPSSTAVATDYDWTDETLGTGTCPATCTTGTCPSGCTNEFLRSFINTENGFGDAATSTAFAHANPLADTRGVLWTSATTSVVNPGTRYYLKSRVVLNSVKFSYSAGAGGFADSNGIPANSTLTEGLDSVSAIGGGCPAPPVGLLGDDDSDFNLNGGNPDGSSTRPCFQVELLATGNTPNPKATFYLASGGFSLTDPNTPCATNVPDNGVESCSHTTADDLALQTTGAVRLELPIGGSGVPTGLVPAPAFPATTFGPGGSASPTNPNTGGGIQLGGDGLPDGHSHPLGATLTAAGTYLSGLSHPGGTVILITDGNETCTGADPVAAAAALFSQNIRTVVVVFPGPASDQHNQIAYAGSGGTQIAISGGTLLTELDNAVSAAIAQSGAGSFSAADTTVTESVFEFFSPNAPNARYAFTEPVIYQTSFSMPGWKGHLAAYFSSSGTVQPRWPGANDAGDKLMKSVTLTDTTLCPSDPNVTGCADFATLTGGATIANVATSSAKIKRRVFTTTRNGVYLPTVSNIIQRTAQPEVVGLWPPSAAVDPAAGTVGTLDAALGLPTSTTYNATSFQTLKSTYGACAGAPFPSGHACLGADNAAMGAAIKEAREVILAYTAGATVLGGTAPNRGFVSPTPSTCPGCLLFVTRPWILAETTLSAPAVVTTPLQLSPAVHVSEYDKYRDGPRVSGVAVKAIDQGFGLRNPDTDGQTASANDPDLKPTMSMVVLGANDGLHAFRAGPNCDQSAGACTETGGEELWSFVPFDQLGKLSALLRAQARDPHTYMIASALRFGDVFVPGAFSQTIGGATVTGAGVWRTVMVFGRGIGASYNATTPACSPQGTRFDGVTCFGSNYYTGLDVTAPGPYTRTALTTNLPIVYWSRGNPDTNDGTLAGTKNGDTFDYNAYLRMGETWSVPALALVNATDTTTKLATARSGCAAFSPSSASNSTTTEFLFYTGSGYSASGAGTTFYGLDVNNGNVIRAADVCGRSPAPTDALGTAIPNALVGNPAVFNASQLSAGTGVGNSGQTVATRVYFGDLHGRLWKFNINSTSAALLAYDLTKAADGTTSVGSQPVANGLALLNLNSDASSAKPHVFVEAGNDRRFPFDTSKPFKAFGFRDNAPDNNIAEWTSGAPSAVMTRLFALDFPVASATSGFRGNAQPATAFNSSGQGRAFFLGTRFNPSTNCAGSFDSIIFAVGAATGGAAYDFGVSYQLTGQKAISIRVDRGELVVDKGLAAGNPPSAPAPPAVLPGAAGTGEVKAVTPFRNSAVCK